MKYRRSIAIIIMLVISPSVWAANPADLTSFYHFGSGEYYMYGNDSGNQWLFASAAVSKSASAYIYPWQSKDGKVQSTEFAVVKAASDKVDFAFSTTMTTCEGSNNTSNVVYADWHSKKFGLGLMVPLDGDVKIGPRYQLSSKLTLFATLAKNVQPTLGFTLSEGKYKIEAAHDLECNTTSLRVSTPINSKSGTICPQIRLFFTEDETRIGFAVGFAPK